MDSSRKSAVQVVKDRVLALPRFQKQAAMILADAVGMAFAVLGAVWLAMGDVVATVPSTLWLMLAAIIASISIAWWQGLYQSIIRYIGIDLFASGTKTVLAVTLVMGSLVFGADLVPSPGRWVVAFFMLSLLYVIGGRFSARVFLNRRLGLGEPVIIYGAGEGGARLTAALKNGNDFTPVALLDDNPLLCGKRVDGVEVYSPADLKILLAATEATRILLAMPSASRYRRRAVLERLSEFPVRVQTIPEVSDLVNGKARVEDIRDVDVADLLGRDSVPPDTKLMRTSIDGKAVMVTGAGGSIGSELCRQILHLGPKCLLVFERSEIALYNIEKELRETATSCGIDCEFVAQLGSVHHEERVREILQTYDIGTVYHAAAYKHVPVVEQNFLEGIHNNAFGTWHLAKAAIDSNVETFVLISTDKAVSPTSVMGATKRLAELILQALQDAHQSIRFSMVRFGNVLESSGSVVPLFRDQIRKGGPVTVTHREIIRYFMTIPEAAQLVIQAGAMAKGGDVFVLDMGQPVKIRDLARRMINLMGFTVRDEHNPDGEIAIQYTGLRPAEKLFEELLIGSDVCGTIHPRIMRASEDYLPFDKLLPLLKELRMATEQLDRDRVREVLKLAVSGYQPANGIDDLVWARKHGVNGGERDKKVIDITTRRA